ncbi:MAG: DUF2867 domain-containing protein [Chloroflexota bacterium]
MSYLSKIEAVQDLLTHNDHFDVKTVTSEASLREFIVGMLSYHPTWIKALYGIRAGFVRLLGMKQEAMTLPKLTVKNLPFEHGQWATFFQVHDAKEDDYWIATASDKHLDAYIVIAKEQLSSGLNKFHIGTIVHYKNWAGPIYFNIIRPFHHIVVQSMAQAGASYRVAHQGSYS